MDKKFRILITGVSGFLGAAMLEYFCGKGHIVKGLTRESSSLWRVPSYLNPNAERTRIEEWEDKIIEFEPEIVICASWSGVEAQMRELSEIQYENIRLHANLARLSKRIGVTKFIAFGSQAEGVASSETIDETAITSGISAYGNAKQAILQEIVEIFHDEREYAWIRIFSIYGPKDHRKTLISKLFLSLWNESDQEFIMNEDLLWSFLYIDDFCTAVEMVISNAKLTGVVNLGNPHLNTIGNVRDLILGLSPRNYVPSRNAFYPKLNKLLDASWRPRVDLELGLAKTRNWYETNKEQNFILEKTGE